MCGLVGGITSSRDFEFSKVCKQLLIADSLRGKHSTGIMSYSLDSNTYLVRKELGDPFNVLLHRKKEPLIDKPNIILGHNRFATIGEITKENAHPFDIGRYIGAHNGTLTRVYDLPDNKDFEVDSENIVHSCDKLGIKDTVELLTGAFALSIFDKNTKQITLCRNYQRPLYFAKEKRYVSSLKEHAVYRVYWASEKEMLEWILKRNKINNYDIEQASVDKLYKFSMKKDFVSIEEEECKTTVSSSYYYPDDNNYNTYWKDWYKGRERINQGTSPIKNHSHSSIIKEDTKEEDKTIAEVNLVECINCSVMFELPQKMIESRKVHKDFVCLECAKSRQWDDYINQIVDVDWPSYYVKNKYSRQLQDQDSSAYFGKHLDEWEKQEEEHKKDKENTNKLKGFLQVKGKKVYKGKQCSQCGKECDVEGYIECRPCVDFIEADLKDKQEAYHRRSG